MSKSCFFDSKTILADIQDKMHEKSENSKKNREDGRDRQAERDQQQSTPRIQNDWISSISTQLLGPDLKFN
jgi:hypothetical protein